MSFHATVKRFVHAAEDGDTQMIAAVLLSSPRFAHIRSTRGRSALHLASENGHLACVETLLAHGASINIRENNEHASLPLIDSVWGGHERVADCLVQKGADQLATDGRGRTAAMVAALTGRLFLKLFSSREATEQVQKGTGDTVLIIAARHGREEIVSALLALWRDTMEDTEEDAPRLNHRNNTGRTALMEAAWGRHDRIVRCLLSHGASPDW